jgi:hypothetical protein
MSTKIEQFFKTCPMCAKSWSCQDSFLDDPELKFNGYQADFEYMEQGIFYFTHDIETCGSTMALKAEMFLSLFEGEKYEENRQMSEECPGKCSDRNQLDRCPVSCKFAFVREISQIIKDRTDKVIS